MSMVSNALRLIVGLGLISVANDCRADFDPTKAVEVKVDASESPRRIQHVHMTIPVKSGPLILLYPKWIPGDHGPTGPINELAGMEWLIEGKPIAWSRDPVDMFTFHCDIPDGATTLELKFDHLGSVPGGGQAWPISESPHLAVLDWNPFVFYPSGIPTDDLKYQAGLTLPPGWKHGTALPLKAKAGDLLTFETTSLTTLIDSPVLAGRFFESIDIASGDPTIHKLELAADSPEALAIKPETLEGYKNLVKETHALFGARHYGEYHFLVALSEPIAHFGLEHHESSVNRLPERSFIDSSSLRTTSSLLPHEMVHSWNGKHRRPKSLANSDYQTPMGGDLLWIYEGLTTYLGRILPARSGLWTADEFRSHLAVVAADAAHQGGRAWRPLADTATSARQLYRAGDAWTFRRRSTDASFYDEGELLWLEVDAIIREGSGDQRSLDDFCMRFHGKPDGAPSVLAYELVDVIAALNSVQTHPWVEFFATRVSKPRIQPPFEGIERSGWRLVYHDEPSTMVADIEKRGKWGFNTGGINLVYSLGLFLKTDGTVQDVVPGMVADRAGMSPGTKILGVDGRKFSDQHIREALKLGRNGDSKVVFIVEDGDFLKTFTLDCHGGERYPALERIEGTRDRLSEILKPTASK